MADTGILPDHHLAALVGRGILTSDAPLAEGQVQPASIDLRLGSKAWRLRASFLPGPDRTVAERLDDDLVMHTVDLRAGAVLETGCVYLAPLQEGLKLPAGLTAAMNPKSSTGRIDVFTRVITDHGIAFDQAPVGYDGPLYAEISPCTFSILAREGDRLSQIRFRQGAHETLREVTVSVDLAGFNDGIVGYRARRHAPMLDLAAKALEILPQMHIPAEERPRLVEFARLGMAVAAAAGHSPEDFLREFNASRQESLARTIDASPVAAAVVDFVEARPHGMTASAKEVLQTLEQHRPPGCDSWPRSAKGLGDALRRAAPALRQTGIECKCLGKVGGTVKWTIGRRLSNQCPTSPEVLLDHHPEQDIRTIRTSRQQLAPGTASSPLGAAFDESDSEAF